MTEFNPNLTQRFVSKAKKRVVPNWKQRMGDYSSRLARWGALMQGSLLMLPSETLPKNFNAYVAFVFFVLIGIAKIITEPERDE